MLVNCEVEVTKFSTGEVIQLKRGSKRTSHTLEFHKSIHPAAAEVNHISVVHS